MTFLKNKTLFLLSQYMQYRVGYMMDQTIEISFFAYELKKWDLEYRPVTHSTDTF